MGTTHSDTVADLTEARDLALRTVRRLARMLRDMPDISLLAPRVESDLCAAMDRHADAENALRLAVDGYAETHPHPAGRIHPSDGYAAKLAGR